jgi:hypothetical protein
MKDGTFLSIYRKTKNLKECYEQLLPNIFDNRNEVKDTNYQN